MHPSLNLCFLAARNPGPLALNSAWCLDVLFSYFSWIGLGVSTVSSPALLHPAGPGTVLPWACRLMAGILKVASMFEQRRTEDGHRSQARVVRTLFSSRQHWPQRPGRECCSPGCTTCLSPGSPSGRCVHCLTLALPKNLSYLLPFISLVRCSPGF